MPATATTPQTPRPTMSFEDAITWATAPGRFDDADLQRALGERQEAHLAAMSEDNIDGLEDAFALAVAEHIAATEGELTMAYKLGHEARATATPMLAAALGTTEGAADAILRGPMGERAAARLIDHHDRHDFATALGLAVEDVAAALRILPPVNHDSGFHGTMLTAQREAAPIAWEMAMRIVAEATGAEPAAVRRMLDSRFGEHIASIAADHYLTHGIMEHSLRFAVDTLMAAKVGARQSRADGVAYGQPLILAYIAATNA